MGAAALMIVAMSVFFLGSKRYKKNLPAGSEILEAAQTFGSAIARKLCPCAFHSSSTASTSTGLPKTVRGQTWILSTQQHWKPERNLQLVRMKMKTTPQTGLSLPVKQEGDPSLS